MTVIVMLILAGVSLNALVGDNGIITNAQNATVLSGCAALEEFLQQEYISLGDIDNSISPLENLLRSPKLRYFQKSKNNNNYFLDPETFNKCYFINKSALPREIQASLVGGNTQIDGIYAEYADVYGVNQDLEVYYVSDGRDSIYGATIEEDIMDSTQIALRQSTDASFIEQLGFDRDLSYRDLSGINEVTITDNSADFSKYYMLNALQKVTFRNVTLDSLDGISNAKNINFIIFYNCDIKNYRGLAECENLVELYIYMSNALNTNISNDQVKNLCSNSIGVGDIDFKNLKYLGIMGFDVSIWPDKVDASTYRVSGSRNNLTDISPLENFYSGKNVKYLYLTYTSITSVESLSGFTNLYLLDIQNTPYLANLDGLENHTFKYLFVRNSGIENIEGLTGCKDLVYIYATSCANLTSLYGLESDNIGRCEFAYCSIDSSDENALKSLSNAKKLSYLNLENNNIVNVDDLENVTSIAYLYLAGNNDLNGTSLKKLKPIIDKCVAYSIPTSLSLALLDSTTKELNISSQTLTKSNFESLIGMTNLEKLNIASIDIVANDNSTLTSSQKEEIIDSVLETLTGIMYLNLENLNFITHISFVESMRGLREINLKNTNATTGTTTVKIDQNSGEQVTKNTGLELLNDLPYCCALAITNSSIDLSKIVPTLNRMKLGYAANSCKYTSGALSVSQTVNTDTLNKAGIGLTSLALYNTTKNNINLSLCTSLTRVSTCYSNMSIVWPDSITYWYNDNCGACAQPPTSLTWYYMHNGSGQTMLSRMATRCPNLTYFNNGNSSDWDFSFLENAVFKDSIKTLSISDSPYHFGYRVRNISNIECLSNLSALTNLNISYTKITNILSFVDGLSNLEVINLNNTNLSTFEGFERLSNLTHIYANNCSLSSLHYLEELHNLELLSITNHVLEDIIQYTESYTENGEPKTRLVTVYNLDILNNLNINYKLKKLYLSSTTSNLTTINRLVGTYTEKDF